MGTVDTVVIPGNPSFSGVDFVDSKLGYASSNSGKIYITTRRFGLSPQSSNTTTFLTNISFADQDNGYAVGFGGTIVYTDDGGTKMKQATTGTTNNLWGVCAVSSTIGYAVGGDGNGVNGNVLKATDCGGTWNRHG